ncbi:MAG: hypothetical protein JXR58_07035 [Bacteroidales bacterium]|nr:hypothetical protein [Bacteroidales bacterium]
MFSEIKRLGNYKTDIKTIAIVLLGLVFIFSGFVKIIEPISTRETFHDYLGEMLNLKQYYHGTMVYLLAGILFSAFEFILGIALVIRFKPILTIWVSLLLMGFFTFLTLFLAVTDILPHCGCLGEALKLSNWDTFFKNIAIMIPTLFVFICRKNFAVRKTSSGEWIIIIFGFILMIVLSLIKYYS